MTGGVVIMPHAPCSTVAYSGIPRRLRDGSPPRPCRHRARRSYGRSIARSRFLCVWLYKKLEKCLSACRLESRCRCRSPTPLPRILQQMQFGASSCAGLEGSSPWHPLHWSPDSILLVPNAPDRRAPAMRLAPDRAPPECLSFLLRVPACGAHLELHH